MAFCSTCGTQGDAAAFCTNCGAAIDSGASAKDSSASGSPSSTAPQNWNTLQTQKTNTFAIVALVVSLVGSLFGLGWVGSIFGHISLGQIKRTNEGGRGLAIAGIVIGYATVAIFAVALIVFLVSIALGTAVNSSIENVSPSL